MRVELRWSPCAGSRRDEEGAMARALMATVGTGTRPDADTTRPLIASIENSNPVRVVFLITPESQPLALKVAREVGLPEGSWRLVPVGDMDDVNGVFRVAVEEIRRLTAEGYAERDIEADYTTGTKSMSVGLALAAVGTGCRALKYVGGRRNQAIVISGTERVYTMQPGAVIAFMELDRVHSLLRDLRFDAALDVRRGVNPWLLEEGRWGELEDLEKIIRGYDRWDKFDHIGAVELLRQVDFDRPWNAPYRIPREMLERLRGLGSTRKAGSITEDMLADLANNGWRRWREGKHDDAVARLYRLTEMVAQRKLKEGYTIKAGNVELHRVPEELRAKLEVYRSERDGKIQIGLAACYSLLGELESRAPLEQRDEVSQGERGKSFALGAAFAENPRMPELLKARNQSILAHGLEPVAQEVCEGFFGEVMALCRVVVPDLDSRREALQFPWLRGQRDPGGRPG